MKARIKIMLKSGVLDPQGAAIKQALNNIGFESVTGVRQGKVIELEVDGPNKSEVRSEIESMCNKMLANTVIENFEIEVF
ncbi:MAG: phosphoribosylformylglycinamidine synthase subunit PurS [Paracoccaceae bacterium]|jgi:phosphoribosylformylglycinamidine synthase|nr:phosphoribosylformylglycinamidine synthase [Marinovum sp.]MAV71319.1 phosphoribosylformylglycinamidine synthase [Marinovum sp.]|tara:strand:- start:356 stop:595 length:240 start_codon:yes stop_codon:yes gene_type:complete